MNQTNLNNLTLEHVLNNPQKPIEEMFTEKQEFIKKQSASKQNSMRDFAIKRDATMFAVAELGRIPVVSDNVEKTLKELHEKWLMYFETIYGENGHE